VAFLKADAPEELDLILKMKGELAELFAELNTEFKLNEEGILYLRCQTAQCGQLPNGLIQTYRSSQTFKRRLR
jgi:hypothetical protein